MLLRILVFLLSITYVKATGCPGKYQYYRQPPTNFTDCNPVRTILILTCTVLVSSDSSTVTVDWYWSKNINECGRNIAEKQGRFTMRSSRKTSHITNVDCIITDLNILSPQTDTGYYWCQVNDPSYNGVFISSNKASVFDTGTMTNCNGGKQSIIKTNCAVGSVPTSLCLIPTKTTLLSPTSLYVTPTKTTTSPTTNYELNYITTTPIPVLNTSITNINIPKPTSQNLKRSGVISTVHISSSSNDHEKSATLNSIVISPTVTLQETSSDIIVISTTIAVFVLLILLILPLTTIIINKVVTKKKTNCEVTTTKSISTEQKDNNMLSVEETSSQVNVTSTRKSPPPCPAPYSSKLISKEDTRDTNIEVITYADLQLKMSSFSPSKLDPVVCSNPEDTPPLSTIEPVIYSAVVRKNDTKVTVKISTFVDNIDTL